MKKIVLINGLIAGAIATSWALGYMTLSHHDLNSNMGMIYGYASMILGFSLIFVGVKSYRDKQNGGVISFGKAFRMGLYITLIASTMYVVAWEIMFFNTELHEFGKTYSAHLLANMQKAGASAADIARRRAELQGWVEQYNNLFFNSAQTYMEILPVGLLVSLIAALVLKRKKI